MGYAAWPPRGGYAPQVGKKHRKSWGKFEFLSFKLPKDPDGNLPQISGVKLKKQIETTKSSDPKDPDIFLQKEFQ